VTTLRQIAALMRLVVRHWTRSALTVGAAAKGGGKSRSAGLVLRLAFVLILAQSFHQMAATAVSGKGAGSISINWLLTGMLVVSAGFTAVQLLPMLRGARLPLRAELLETLPVSMTARVVLALLQNIIGITVCIGVVLGAASPLVSRPAAVLLGVALFIAGGVAGIAGLALARAIVPAHHIARFSWVAMVGGVLGILIVQMAPMLTRAGLSSPLSLLLDPCARALGGGPAMFGLIPPAAIVAVSAAAIAIAERRGYDRLAAPPPGKPKVAPPKRMTPESVDRLLTAREMSVVLRTVLLAMPPLCVLALVLIIGRRMSARNVEMMSLGASFFVLQIAGLLGLSLAGRSAIRDARARPLLAPLTIVPADTLAGKERSLRRLLLPPAIAPLLLAAIAPPESLPVVITRGVALLAGMAMLCSAAPSMAFLTNGLGSGHAGSGASMSPATLLLLLPLVSAVVASEPWSAGLSLLLLGLITFEARRAALRCVRWLDDAAEDVERDTPVWRALLVLGAFFAVQALFGQLLSFLLPARSAGLLAGLTYLAGAAALLLLTQTGRTGPKLAWIPARRRFLLLVGPLAGIASGALAQLYLRAIQWVGVELPAPPPLAPLDALVLGAAVVLAAPIAEEVFFRGWLQESVAGDLPAARRRFAPMIVAVAFALVHPSLSFVPVLVLGAMAGELYVAAGALLPGILAHAAHNAIALLLAPR
jgi:hypothetical protein